MDQDLKTRHFSAVFTAIDASEETAIAASTRNLIARVGGNPYALAVVTALFAVLILMCLRPPFILQFEMDRRRPWQAKTQISWIAVGAVGLLVGSAAALLPAWLQQPPSI